MMMAKDYVKQNKVVFLVLALIKMLQQELQI
jgi:hypothetical protein